MLRPTSSITADEVRRLLFELSLGSAPGANKRALQDICNHYEAGRFLRDTSEVRPLIHSHLHAGDPLLRRWSFKALGLIGSADDVHRIVDRLKVESDHEAVTWGSAALFRKAGAKSLAQLAKEAGLDTDRALVLAARLYADEDWVKANIKPVSISLNDDPLILKWAIFLAGYDKAPASLFDPRYENEVFLGELNNHDTPEVSEYSLWALWERKEFGPRYARIDIGDVGKHNPSVRKWVYRLYAASPDIIGMDNQMVFDLRSNDHSAAVEGLARGIVDVNDGRFDESILTWYAEERDPVIKATLISGIVRRADDNAVMSELAAEEFSAARTPERNTMLAAAAGRGIYQRLRVRERADLMEGQGLLALSGPGTVLIQNVHGGVGNMSGGNSIKVGGNLQAQNVAAGDMVDSAHNAVQNIQSVRAADKEVLDQVLQFLRSADPSEPAVRDAYAALENAANNPIGENKKGLLSSLRKLGPVASAGGGLAEIISLVSSWIG